MVRAIVNATNIDAVVKRLSKIHEDGISVEDISELRIDPSVKSLLKTSRYVDVD